MHTVISKLLSSSYFRMGFKLLNSNKILVLVLTVSGLAKIEGEVIEVDEHPDEQNAITTKYQLTGIVVHSGQASGGHYFSYILHRYVLLKSISIAQEKKIGRM